MRRSLISHGYYFPFLPFNTICIISPIDSGITLVDGLTFPYISGTPILSPLSHVVVLAPHGIVGVYFSSMLLKGFDVGWCEV